METESTELKRRPATTGEIGQLTRMLETSTFTSVSGNARAHIGDHYGEQHIHGTFIQYAGNTSVGQDQSSSADYQGNLAHDSMALLKYPEMDARYENTKLAHRSTCEWLPNHHAYRAWRNPAQTNQHGNFFWIKGKPGAGKSTLMKSAVQHASSRYCDETAVFFFFNARGAAIEKSIEGMYRSILYQLLERFPRMQNVLPQSHNAQKWQIPPLQTLIQKVIHGLAGAELTCYIDALDECNEDDVRDMIDFFEGLGQSAGECGTCLRVCFSSRHYPRITISRSIELILDDLDEHEHDIATYVHSTLRISEDAFREEFANTIRVRARGIFLWVVLVVGILNKESDRGYAHDMRLRLDKIPDGVHRLFDESIVERGADDKGYLLPILLWVLFAEHPLELKPLYHAVICWNEFRPFVPEPHMRTMQAFILNASKGLVEFTKEKHPTNRPKAQFIHQTVRDYLLAEGIIRLDSSLGTNPQGLSHGLMAQWCGEYVINAQLAVERSRLLDDDESPSDSSSNGSQNEHDGVRALAPFINEALINLVRRAEDAHKLGVPQQTFVESFPLHAVRFHSPESPDYTNRVTKAYIFANTGAPHLLKLELLRLRESRLASGEHGGLAGPPDEQHAGRGDSSERSCGRFQNALQAAAAHADHESASLLLEHGVDVNAEGGYYGNALQAACARGDERIVRLLLENGAIVSTEGGYFGNPLQAAYARGDERIMRLLLENGAIVSTEGGYYDNPLQAACDKGNEGIIRLLLENGAIVSTEGGRYGNALQAACFRGNEGIVRLLLENGAIVSAEGGHYGNALQAACYGGNEGIVRLLLENGAIVSTEGGHYGNPLQAACYEGNEVIVRLLLENGAIVSTEGGYYGDALQAACAGGNEGIVRLLLENGAIVSTEGGHYGNPLQAACYEGNEGIVRLLLENGAIVGTEGGHYGNALQAACYEGTEGIVRLLLQHGADVNLQGGEYQNALQTATERGARRIAELLIAHGAEVPSGYELPEPR